MPDHASAEPQAAERRVAPRLRTLKRAKVLFNNRFSTIDCIVRNVSRTGALLTVDTAVHLPKTFEVIIADDEPRPSRLVYRREMFAGIRFLDIGEEDPSDEADIQAARDPEDQRNGHDEGIARIVADPLPSALTRRFPWSRFA